MILMSYGDILSLFPKEREEKLRVTRRFSMFEVFFYRSSLWHHELRVALLADELSAFAAKTLPAYDPLKARLIALFHDDAELITGDIQLGHKQLMSPEELRQVDDNEAAAIETISKSFPETVLGYSYRELLFHALGKDCLEAQLVTYADKLDAYCESMHDLLGGNITALRAVMNYDGVMPEIKKKYSGLAPLFLAGGLPLIDLDLRTEPRRVLRKNYAHLNKPHTPESIRQDTEFSFYNKWREIVLANLGEEGAEMLTRRLEK